MKKHFVAVLCILMFFGGIRSSRASFPVGRTASESAEEKAYDASLSLELGKKKPKRKKKKKKKKSAKKKKSSKKRKKRKKKRKKTLLRENQYIALILAFPLFGLAVGLHRFYLGHHWMGLLYLLLAAISPLTYWYSLGVVAVMALIDFVRILFNKQRPASGSYNKTIKEYFDPAETD